MLPFILDLISGIRLLVDIVSGNATMGIITVVAGVTRWVIRKESQ